MSCVSQISIVSNTLWLAKNILGCKKVIIDSGVYAHMYNDKSLNPEDDIIVIENVDGIDMDDIMDAIGEIEDQCTRVKSSGRSYFLDNIVYLEENNTYRFVWGS